MNGKTTAEITDNILCDLEVIGGVLDLVKQRDEDDNTGLLGVYAASKLINLVVLRVIELQDTLSV